MRRRFRAAGRIPEKTLTGKVGEPSGTAGAATPFAGSWGPGLAGSSRPGSRGYAAHGTAVHQNHGRRCADAVIGRNLSGEKLSADMGLSMGRILVPEALWIVWAMKARGPAGSGDGQRYFDDYYENLTDARSRIRLPGRKRSVPLAKRRKVSRNTAAGTGEQTAERAASEGSRKIGRAGQPGY